MESTINQLIEIRKDFSFLANDKALTQQARDEHADKAAALKDAIDSLVECFDLKVCEGCDCAFERADHLDTICEGCEEHRANRMASDRADLDWHRGF